MTGREGRIVGSGAREVPARPERGEEESVAWERGRAELGLWRRFRRHISDAFEAKREHLLRDAADSESFCYVQEEAARYAVAEDCDEYLAENIFWDEGSFQRDALPDLRADFVLAKPPFNISDWGGERLREDARWQYAVPPAGNANYAWLQHIVHHLRPTGTAGVVLANGSMSSQQSGEGDIRRAMVEGDVVDCMVALPPQLSYSTQIPVCLWFLARDKRPAWKGGAKGARDRRGEVLFIDARKLGHLVDRTRGEFSDEDIVRIAGAYHA